MKWSFVIPNYNGAKLLENNLPSVLTAANGHEVIVVDDASTDNSLMLLKNKFKNVLVAEHSQNLGFAAACNSGVKLAKGELVMLLNSDCSPRKNIIGCLEIHFKDDLVFSVGCMEKYSEEYRGKSIGKFMHGLVKHAAAPDRLFGPTFWSFGAAAAYNREKWMEIGGMDTLFRPAYWEDIDISYNAWKRGWKVLFEPKAVVNHNQETTNQKVFGLSKMKVMSTKNQFLFIWKNISEIKLILNHLFWLPLILSRAFVKNDYYTIQGFKLAIVQLNEALSKRKKSAKYHKLNDSEIFKMFSG
jgi:GT2 family glycosyltransferase